MFGDQADLKGLSVRMRDVEVSHIVKILYLRIFEAFGCMVYAIST